MDPSSPVADLTAFYIQEIGAALFGMVFLFLWRQSRAVYFGLWAVAWVMRLFATFFGFAWLRWGHSGWLAPYAVFEFGFVIVLIAAARAGFSTSAKDWRTVLRLISILPIFVALVWALGRFDRLEAYQASHAVALCFVYAYNIFGLRGAGGVGARVLRFSLLILSFAFLEHAVIFVYLYNSGAAPEWARYLHHETYYDFVLHAVMAFAAMAMWSESQIGRIRELASELDGAHRLGAAQGHQDGLTGLLNQTALEARVAGPGAFEGVVAVCDMDRLKDVNDSCGHLVGDEVLRSIGRLLQVSIRAEDEAFRWGGDEFVVLFHNQLPGVASKRLADIEARLRNFRVRGLGALPISFSWGTAEGRARPLRQALEEADREMYAMKRARTDVRATPRGET